MPNQPARFLAALAAALLSAASSRGQVAEPPEFTPAAAFRRLVDLDRLYRPTAPGETSGFVARNLAVAADAARAEGGWAVVFEQAGPGLVTRLWCDEPAGEVRIELDGEEFFAGAFASLFDGSRPPFAPPFAYLLQPPRSGSCYVPLTFANSCRILTREFSGACELSVTRLAPETVVAPLRLPLDADTQAAAEGVARVLLSGYAPKEVDATGRILPIALQETLAPGAVLSDAVAGKGIVRAVYVALTDRANPLDPYALHRCVLRFYFDGASSPQVEAPVSDFFGSGVSFRAVNTLLVGTEALLDLPLPDRRVGEDRYCYAYLPMPFEEGFRVELVNASDESIGLLLYLRVDTTADVRGAWRFNSTYRMQDPARGATFPMAELRGDGRWLGGTLSVDCPRRDGWGRGGLFWQEARRGAPAAVTRSALSWLGTAPPASASQTAFHAMTQVGAYGKSAGLRWLIGDAVEYRGGLRIELNRAADAAIHDTYFGSVVYWYAPPDAPRVAPPLQTGDLAVPGLRIPGAIEIEGRVRGEGWGAEVAQERARGVEYSGERAVSLVAQREIEIEIPALEARDVELKVRVNPRRAFGTVTITARGGGQIATIAYDRRASGVYSLGSWALASGANPVTVRADQTVILDCWIAE